MEMSFAQALNEAKQVIVQQSNRIKTDADKVRQQQQTIVDQCSIITDHEMKNKEQAAELASKSELIEQLETKLALDRDKMERTSRVVSQVRGRVAQVLTARDELVREGAPVVLLHAPKSDRGTDDSGRSSRLRYARA